MIVRMAPPDEVDQLMSELLAWRRAERGRGRALGVHGHGVDVAAVLRNQAGPEPEHLREIVDLMLEKTRQRIAEQSITLHVSDAARALLAEHGYDPVYGARPLRRTVQRMLDDLLAESLLRREFQSGDAVEVDVADGQLVASVMVGVGVSSGQVAA